MKTATIVTIMTITTSTTAERESHPSLRFFFLAGLSFGSPRQFSWLENSFTSVANSPTVPSR
jgi:hypothetical protein